MNFKHLINKFGINKLGLVNEQHIRITLAVGAIALFVLGAGAPAGFDN